MNGCGTDTETITVNYQNCIAPVITVVAPTSNGTTVSSANFNLSALILNSNNGQGITLSINGRTITNFSFNNATSAFQSTVALVPGLNTFVLTSVNSCGTDTETITINYDNCVPPVITITNPTVNGTTVTSSVLNLGALIQNSNNGQGITLNINGRAISNFTFLNATGVFQSTLNLTPGLNTFVLTSVNGCGTDTETITVNYDNCVPPVITITNPTVNGTTVTSSVLNLGALIQNSNNGQGITLNINGRAISNFTFLNATGVFQSTLNLTPGLNTFVLTSVNGCGTDTETITVNYDNCVPPVITITNPTVNGTTVSSSTFGFSALIQNTNNGQGITLMQNNIAITGFNFNSNLSTLQSATTLIPGLNTFVISVNNSCGNASKTVTIFYKEPVVEEQIISICHHPPGNPENTQNLQIPLSAWPAHQAHGDVLGACPEQNNNEGGSEGGGNGKAAEEGGKTPQNGGKENPKGGNDKKGEVKPIDKKNKPEVIPPTTTKGGEGKGGK